MDSLFEHTDAQASETERNVEEDWRPRSFGANRSSQRRHGLFAGALARPPPPLSLLLSLTRSPSRLLLRLQPRLLSHNVRLAPRSPSSAGALHSPRDASQPSAPSPQGPLFSQHTLTLSCPSCAPPDPLSPSIDTLSSTDRLAATPRRRPPHLFSPPRSPPRPRPTRVSLPPSHPLAPPLDDALLRLADEVLHRRLHRLGSRPRQPRHRPVDGHDQHPDPALHLRAGCHQCVDAFPLSSLHAPHLDHAQGACGVRRRGVSGARSSSRLTRLSSLLLARSLVGWPEPLLRPVRLHLLLELRTRTEALTRPLDPAVFTRAARPPTCAPSLASPAIVVLELAVLTLRPRAQLIETLQSSVQVQSYTWNVNVAAGTSVRPPRPSPCARGGSLTLSSLLLADHPRPHRQHRRHRLLG